MSKKNKPTDDQTMRLYAQFLQNVMTQGYGFTLFVFETNSVSGKISYISSAQREDMKDTLQEMLNKWNRGDWFDKPNQN